MHREGLELSVEVFLASETVASACRSCVASILRAARVLAQTILLVDVGINLDAHSGALERAEADELIPINKFFDLCVCVPATN
jgi:hypothetical protein